MRRRQRARQLKRVSLRKLKHAGALLQRSTLAPALEGGGAKDSTAASALRRLLHALVGEGEGADDEDEDADEDEDDDEDRGERGAADENESAGAASERRRLVQSALLLRLDAALQKAGFVPKVHPLPPRPDVDALARVLRDPTGPLRRVVELLNYTVQPWRDLLI